MSEDSACKSEEFKFPVSRPDDRAIPSGRPYRPDVRQTSIIRPGDVFIPSGPHTVSRSFCAKLHPSGRLSSPSGRPSMTDQLHILSKFRIREVNTSVRTMWYTVRTRVSIRQESKFKYQGPDVSQPWSGRVCNLYGNC
jgi:hypothetical protein